MLVTNYLVDSNRDYAQVLEERDGSGNLLVRYVYGHDLISQERGGTTSYYHYDGLGSTRALTASSEAVTDTYIYDAFGNLLDKTGTTTNNHLFTGEFFDTNVGFYYLRARYMDPNVGRFVTMDTFAGRNRDPYSLHKYLYAHANPMNNTDPTGNFAISIHEMDIVGLMRNILARVSFFAYTAARRALIGGLFGAVVGGIDAKIQGQSFIDGAVRGGLSGAAFCALSTVKVLEPILIYMGFKWALEGIQDAIQQKQYGLAAFRSSVLLVMGYLMTKEYWQHRQITKVIPQFIRSLKKVTKNLQCTDLAKIVIRTFAPKSKIVFMTPKGGGTLPTQDPLPKNWDHHAASVLSNGEVYDPLLELPFSSVKAWQKFIVGSNSVNIQFGEAGSPMTFQLADGTFLKM